MHIIRQNKTIFFFIDLVFERCFSFFGIKESFLRPVPINQKESSSVEEGVG